MRILMVHNEYKQAGGEDNVVQQELDLLASEGHEIRLHSVTSKTITDFRKVLHTGLNVSYSKGSKQQLLQAIEEFRPHVVHVHNFFPLLTPSIYDACLEARIPIVQTLHNYRLTCPGAFLMRDGKVCEKCIGRSAYWGVVHGCYRESRFASFPVARMVETHRRQHTWELKVDRFVALTHFAKDKFIQAGFPGEKIVVKPNFIRDPFEGGALPRPKQKNSTPTALFVGRLSEEKGVRVLINAWKKIKGVRLRVAGDGPLMPDLIKAQLENVEILGNLTKNEVSQEMLQADFMIMPSIWYEGFPMVLAESLAHGLPSIVSKMGGMQEVIQDGVTGLHFTPSDSDDLILKIHQLVENVELQEKMSATARHTYLEQYTPKANYNQLISLYNEVSAVPDRARILALHNYYQIRSGEDLAFDASINNLRSRGHAVQMLTRHNKVLAKKYWLPMFFSYARLPISSIFSFSSFFETLRMTKTWKPDVAVVQNVIPLLSPGVYLALKIRRIPVVQWIYNYRLVCPNGILYTKGKICERCVKGSYWNAIRFACYRKSYLASAVLSLALGLWRFLGIWKWGVQRYLTPDQFLGTKILHAVKKKEKITTLYNPVSKEMVQSISSQPRPRNRDILYVGRLVKAKGIHIVVECARQMPQHRFVVIGTGESEAIMHERAKSLGLKNIRWLGPVYGKQLQRYLDESGALILPSQWYDNMPLVLTQALLSGTPIVASNINGIPEFVIDGVTGRLAEPGDAQDFVSKITDLFENKEKTQELVDQGLERARAWFSVNQYHQGFDRAIQEFLMKDASYRNITQALEAKTHPM